MVLPTNRNRAAQGRGPSRYNLEISGRFLVSLTVLVGLSGLVVFYMGVVTGMSMRTADAPPPVAAGETQRSTVDDDMAFLEGLQSKEGLLKDFQRPGQPPATPPTPGKELAAEETNSHPAETAPAKKAEAAPKTAPNPPLQKKAPPADDGKRYTVQVFSSRYRERANELIVQLKKQGFPAYLNQYQGPDKTVLYRVRVGKGSRAEADKLQARLIQEAKMKAPSITPL